MTRAKHVLSDVEGTQSTRSWNFEARNPKFETNSNDSKAQNSKHS
jgi:hypothetical protein